MKSCTPPTNRNSPEFDLDSEYSDERCDCINGKIYIERYGRWRYETCPICDGTMRVREDEEEAFLERKIEEEENA